MLRWFLFNAPDEDPMRLAAEKEWITRAAADKAE
jgi:hypothetical protein